MTELDRSTTDATFQPGVAASWAPRRGAARNILVDRLALLVKTLGGIKTDDLDVLARLVEELVGRRADRLWLAHAIIAAVLPDDDEVSEMRVRATLFGTWDALAPALKILGEAKRHREVRVIEDQVTCDVHGAATSDFLSGIQRVVREVAARWQATHDLQFVCWTAGFAALRPLRSEESLRLFAAGGAADAPDAADFANSESVPIVVPWGCVHIVAEVAGERERSAPLLALARYSSNDVVYVGYDVIPITSAATVNTGMTTSFARYLSAVRAGERVAMISEAAAQELRGWIAMGSGRRGSELETAVVPLPASAPAASLSGLEEARAALIMDDRTPMVLVVGSHEPRKNHLAVLHSAEMLWREGHRFNLVLVGAGSWNASAYQAALAELVDLGRPVQSFRGLSDRLLWAAYELAHCTVFPSLNEGFGLPVAESLAAGTPVVTSNFGSMREIVAPFGTPLGGLLVDPRSDDAIRDGLRTVLTDTALYARLCDESAQHSERTWDTYADELWGFLVDGTVPAPIGL